MTNRTKLEVTADGSSTLYSYRVEESYHSKHGAIQEANHVFIKNGLKKVKKNKLSILEVGFGTGLNTLLTLIESIRDNIFVDYTTIEKFPLDSKIIDQLNYNEKLKLTSEERDLYNLIHKIRWDQGIPVVSNFNLKKVKVDIIDYEDDKIFDLIYFDAFSPNSQPEMWEEKIFKRLYHSLSHEGCLVTYCAKGSLKRTLKKVGFFVETLPGPPGKREMISAKKLN